LALYAQYRAQGEAFVPKYLEFLSAGGSATPQELLLPLGVDLSSPQVWDPGFEEMDRMIALAEAG
jgi:oligoendopeptidase F